MDRGQLRNVSMGGDTDVAVDRVGVGVGAGVDIDSPVPPPHLFLNGADQLRASLWLRPPAPLGCPHRGRGHVAWRWWLSRSASQWCSSAAWLDALDVPYGGRPRLTSPQSGTSTLTSCLSRPWSSAALPHAGQLD
nr:hypothetical protein CFP56_21521 [Quercus suber]